MIRTLATLGFILASTTSAWAAEQPAAAPTKPAESQPVAEAKAADSKAAESKAPAEIAKLGEFKYVPKDTDIVYGNENAPLTMVEYASFSCSHCGMFYREVFPSLQKNYIDTGKLKFVFRSYPLNQPALEAAQMVQCAPKDTRIAYVRVLFNTQEKWAYDASFHEALAGIAVLGGMERSKFDACIADKEVQSSVLLVYQEAQTDFKVTSTPTLFLNNQIVKGDHSLATINRALDKALASPDKK